MTQMLQDTHRLNYPDSLREPPLQKFEGELICENLFKSVSSVCLKHHQTISGGLSILLKKLRGGIFSLLGITYFTVFSK